MKKIIVFLLLVVCSSAYADKALHLSVSSKAIHLSENDYNILLKNTIFFEKSYGSILNYQMSVPNIEQNEIDKFMNCVTDENSLEGKTFSEWLSTESGKRARRIVNADELKTSDVLAENPFCYMKDVIVYRHGEYGYLYLKTESEKDQIYICDYASIIENIPSFGKKFEMLLLYRCIVKLPNNSNILGWCAKTFKKTSDEKYHME